MRSISFLTVLVLLCSAASYVAPARNLEEPADTSDGAWKDTLSQVVVTGTRNKTDIRHLPLTVTVLDRPSIEYSFTPSLLPVLTEQVPGFSPPPAVSWATGSPTARPAISRSAV